MALLRPSLASNRRRPLEAAHENLPQVSDNLYKNYPDNLYKNPPVKLCAHTRRDARHIDWLRDQLPPERFAGGVVFHTGPRRYGLGPDIEAVPIAALWGRN